MKWLACSLLASLILSLTGCRTKYSSCGGYYHMDVRIVIFGNAIGIYQAVT